MFSWGLFLLLNSQMSQAQVFNQGLVNTSGNYTYNVGTIGAVTNSRTSDLISQQSMLNKQAAQSALASGNIGAAIQYGSQAMTQYQQATQAQNQTHALGQSALNGVNSGSNSGTMDLSKFNSLGVSDLNSLATQTSATYSQAQSMAQSMGISLSENGQYMHTPVGDFPVNTPPDQLAAALGQLAIAKGYDPADVAKGVAAAMASSQALGNQATQEVQALAGAGGGAAQDAGAGTGSVDGSSGADPNRQIASATAGANNRAAVDPRVKGQAEQKPEYTMPANKGDVDWGAMADRVAGYRAKLEREMNLEPIGNKDDNIFRMVHERYVALHQEDVFIAPADMFRH